MNIQPTGWDNNDNEKNDDASNQTHSHLHVCHSVNIMITVLGERKCKPFHHICLRTLLAPRRKPWADTARLSVLSWRESRRSPRCETLLMFSRITPTVSSICYWNNRQPRSRQVTVNAFQVFAWSNRILGCLAIVPPRLEMWLLGEYCDFWALDLEVNSWGYSGYPARRAPRLSVCRWLVFVLMLTVVVVVPIRGTRSVSRAL